MTVLSTAVRSLVVGSCLMAAPLLAADRHEGLPFDPILPPPPEAWPAVIDDQHPDAVALYDVAWNQAWNHRKSQQGLPQSPYMDEACWGDTIWIWDTCYMSLFCKYAYETFPGVESLRNFYLPMHGGYQGLALKIQHPNNPPLFAWVEYDTFRVTADRAHIEQLIVRDGFLQKHYDWFRREQRGPRPRYDGDIEDYHWSGRPSGMDNTPRQEGRIYWLDALAQQGLSALYIARLERQCGRAAEADRWQATYQKLRDRMNQGYWDDQDGTYYDIERSTGAKIKVLTPASFWPMLAEMCSLEQAARMVDLVRRPDLLGGRYPWVSLARNDPRFDAVTGDYWRGGIWLPMAYLGIKALEKYGYDQVADQTAEAILEQMTTTWKTYQPATIWECYNPSKPEPSTEVGRRARPDFCGWSALGPISLYIENHLGIRTVDALVGEVRWDLHLPGRHGIQRLRFGAVKTDLVYDGVGTVTVTSTAPYTLVLNGERRTIAAGTTTLPSIKPRPVVDQPHLPR